MVERSACPSIRSALMLPFTEEAFTGPAMPLRERPPLISLHVLQVGAARHHDAVLHAGRMLGVGARYTACGSRPVADEESTTIWASFKRRGIGRMLDRLHQHLVAVPRGDLHVAVEILNHYPPVRSQRIACAKLRPRSPDDLKRSNCRRQQGQQASHSFPSALQSSRPLQHVLTHVPAPALEFLACFD